MRTRKKTKRCIYSDSCFKCPLSDCRMNTPAQLNCLPLDFEPDTKNFKVVKAHGYAIGICKGRAARSEHSVTALRAQSHAACGGRGVYAKAVLDRRIREIVGEDNFSPFNERDGRG